MTKGRRILRILGGAVGVLAVLLVAGWLAFVPRPKEPGYEFANGRKFESSDSGDSGIYE